MKKNSDHAEPDLDARATSPEAAANVAPIGNPPLTGEEIAELKALAAQLQDQLLRVSADFDNYKKRVARERQDASKYAHESLLQRLIPVLDNFDMAHAAAGSGPNTTVPSLLTGIAMVQQQLKSVLTDAGLEEIDATQKAFDPNLHEALSQEESTEIAEGHVVRQLRKGYKLRDRLLRPASVVVARPPAS